MPILLIDGQRCVKSYNFEKFKYLGDPLNIIRIFNELEVDELIIKSISGLLPSSFLEALASEAFMPVSYGGGVKTFAQAAEIYSLGFEKLIFRTSIFTNMDLLKRISLSFGAQALAISCDVKGKNACLNGNKYHSSVALDEFKRSFCDLEFGELLLTSVDKDGTGSGPNLNLISSVRDDFQVQITYAGGIRDEHDIQEAIECGANAVACSKLFTLHGKQEGVLIWYPGNL